MVEKVDLDCFDGAAKQFKLATGIDELRIVCSNQEIESVDGTLSGEFASNAGGGAGDDGERPSRAVLVLERRCGFGVRRESRSWFHHHVAPRPVRRCRRGRAIAGSDGRGSPPSVPRNGSRAVT